MALLHNATLQPSKADLISAHLDMALTPVGAYRFDDPHGQVGLESHLMSDAGGGMWHIPLTYRSEPLAGAEEWGVGTIQHSVLGTRWVYHGAADPVYVQALIRTILTGGEQAEQYFEEPGGRRYREPTAMVKGSGEPDAATPTISGVHAEAFDTDTLVDAGGAQVLIRHGLHTPEPDAPTATLSGTWEGAPTPVVLAYIP